MSKPYLSMKNLELDWPTCVAAILQYVVRLFNDHHSLAWCCLFCQWWSSVQKWYFPQLASMIRLSSSISVTSIASIEGPSPSDVRSSPAVYRRDSASAAWCFILALWTMSNSYSNRLRRQLARLSLLSVRSRTDFREPGSFLLVNLVFFRYGPNRLAAHTIARHSRCVVSYRRFASVNDLDQYPIGFNVFSGFSSEKPQPNCTSQALVSIEKWRFTLESVTTGGNLSAFFSVRINLSFSSFGVWNVDCWSFRSFVNQQCR